MAFGLRSSEFEPPLYLKYNELKLQELQYARKEAEVCLHLESIAKERRKKFEIARDKKTLKECECCSNDECLDEDMLPW